MKFSVIIPVYNRPDEVDELLSSLTLQNFSDYEIIIVEDGSKIPCKSVVEKYAKSIPINYFTKENSGPAETRNFGAKHANGEFLIFFDSDCIIPPEYFAEVEKEQKDNPVDYFGGPDKSHKTFTPTQKAISYSMTSFFTTGGIRGGKHSMEQFTPRSFNMGIKASAFQQVGGFSAMRFGEDVDLSLRLKEAGFASRLFPNAYVYHKRRTDFRKFFKQVFNSGLARINLNRLHPGSMKLVHFLPTAFTLGNTTLLIISPFFPWLLLLPLLYSLLILSHSLLQGNSIKVALLSIPAAWVQLIGYGCGFIYSFWQWKVNRKEIKGAFVKNFYK